MKLELKEVFEAAAAATPAKPKRVSNKTKATTANAGAGITGALATWASVKYGVPLELTIPVIGIVCGFVGRWAAKLSPHE